MVGHVNIGINLHIISLSSTCGLAAMVSDVVDPRAFGHGDATLSELSRMQNCSRFVLTLDEWFDYYLFLSMRGVVRILKKQEVCRHAHDCCVLAGESL